MVEEYYVKFVWTAGVAHKSWTALSLFLIMP